MSDFINSFWSIYRRRHRRWSASLACLVLLSSPAARKVDRRGDNTTGHVWDEDLRETEQPAAALVDVACSSLTVVFALRLPGALSRAWAAYRRRAGLDARAASTQAEVEKANARTGAAVRRSSRP